MNGGRVSKTRSKIPLLLGALFLAGLAACPNPASQGSNPFSVVQTTPSNGGNNVDPGQPIVVQFNKAVDFSWLQKNAAAVAISPSVSSVDFAYDNATNTLAVNVHPYLVSNKTYTVTVSPGLKAASGDALPQQVSWDFTTGDEPAGDVQVDGGPAADGKSYTNADSVTLDLSCNQSVTAMKFASSEAGLASVAPTRVNSSTSTFIWSLDTTTEGPQTAWVQYVGQHDVLSAAKSATVVRDVTRPVVQVVSLPAYYNMNTTSVVPTVTAKDENGIAHYFWSSNPSGISFVPADSAAPAITMPVADGDYIISLRVADPAGNMSAQQTATIWKDTKPPGRPTVGAPKWGPTVLNQIPLAPTWTLPATSSVANPYTQPADVYILQIDNQLPVQIPLPAIGSNFYQSPSNLSDNADHSLTVWQQDAAGNMSNPTAPIMIHITPVLPRDGAMASMGGLSLQWRDFDSSYTVYFGKDDGSGGFIRLAVSALQTGTSWTPSSLSLIPRYLWYVQGAGTRMPPSDGSYYSFTVTK